MKWKNEGGQRGAQEQGHAGICTSGGGRFRNRFIMETLQKTSAWSSDSSEEVHSLVSVVSERVSTCVQVPEADSYLGSNSTGKHLFKTFSSDLFVYKAEKQKLYELTKQHDFLKFFIHKYIQKISLFRFSIFTLHLFSCTFVV